jgi:hypothetical protein
VNLREQLGRVPWGFDSSDYYRFLFPSSFNDFELTVRLTEQPSFTMWILIYDQSQRLIYTSKGQPNENFSIPLKGGVYYLAVVTDQGTAGTRNLHYILSAKATDVPLPDQGGAACSGAPSIGLLGNQQRDIEGNLSEVRRSSVYRFYTPYGASLQGGMLGPQPSARYTVSLTDRLNGNKIRFRDSELQMQGILVDPGFYCLTIASNGFSGLGNYKGQFVANRAGLVPGVDKSRAQNIIDMELPNLATNGSYGLVSRYTHYKTPGQQPNVPTVVTYNHDYIIRDWVGQGATEQYYWFNLPGKSRVQVRLSNQMAFARAYLEDANGNVLAGTTVDSSSLDPALMPSQSLTATLSGGQRYYLRIGYESNSNPGTSFQVVLNAQPGN